MWSLALHETMTGDLALPIPSESVAGGKWSARLESGGTVTGVVNARDLGLDQPTLHELSEPTGAFELVVKPDDDSCVASGVVLRAPYDRDSGTLSFECKDFSDTFWPARLTAGVNNKTAGSISIVNRSLSGAARAILARAVQAWGPTWPLAGLDLPADGGGSFTLNMDWWEFRNIKELLDQVRAQGTLIHHAPYLTSAGKLRHSTIVSQAIETTTVPVSVTSEESPLKGVKYVRDGLDMITGTQYVGNGKGSGILTAWAGVPKAGVPIRDSYTAATEITEQTRLQGMANADHAKNSSPRVEWGFSVETNEELSPSLFLPGARVNASSYGDSVIPDGLHALYVSACSGDLSSWTVNPEVTPYVS